jgi:hypothetical protein
MSGRLSRALVGLLLLLVLGAPPRAEAAPVIAGSGELQLPVARASFSIESRGAGLYFEFSERGLDQLRSIALDQPSEVECLGELFGGQTVRLTGAGTDSAVPGEPVDVQVWLVDGGARGADRLSVKVKRGDESVVYFAPMRDLDSGQLQISCSA